MDRAELQEFIDRYNDAWNAHDVDAAEQQLVDPGGGVLQVVDVLRRHLERL